MIKLRAVLEMFTKGTDKSQKEVGKINKQLDQAADNAARMNKNLAQTQVGQGAMGRAGIPGAAPTRNYRTQRSITESRGAEGRNFAGMASAGGGTGFVAAYAETAANLFAVTAAFQALANAAKVDQITKGLEILGATSGVTLSNVAKGLQEVTGFGISAADSMRAVALASSAGLTKNEIEELGKIAKGASIALGRDMTDSMDRLTKGAVKLEPELLDELGIMVRLDDAARDYAFANNKTVTSLTLLEKRQAFVNAISAEGSKKFGELAESADPSPYDKLSAGVRDLGTTILTSVNDFIKPFVEILADVPALALLPFTSLLQSVSAKVFPTFDSAMGKSGETAEKYSKKLSLISARNIEISDSMKARDKELREKGQIFSALPARPGMENRKSTIIGPGLVSPELSGISEKQLIKSIDQEILALKNKMLIAEGAHNEKIKKQITTLSGIKLSLREINKERKELVRIQLQELAAQATLNSQVAQRGIIEEFNSNVFSKGLLGALKTGFGDVFNDIIVPGFRDANKGGKSFAGTLTGVSIGFKTLGIAAITTGRLIGMAFLAAIPIIGQLVMVGTMIYSVFAFFESEASKQKKKLLNNLKSINENAKEVEKQIDKAFAREDYGTGFESAITSLKEISDALKEIENLKNGAFDNLGEKIVSKDWESSAKRSIASIFDPKTYSEKDVFASAGGLSGFFIRRSVEESGKGIAETKEQADALNNALARIANIKGLEYAKKVLEEINDNSKNASAIIERESQSVAALAGSWSAVGEEASNAAKTLKKLYGKPITETDYTPVISSLINIQRETNAVTLAFEEAGVSSTTAVAGIYANIAKGGADFSAELDRINQDSSYSFEKTFNQYEALDYKIRAMRTAGASEAAVQEVISEQNLLAVEAVQKLLGSELLIKGKIRDTEQFILDRRKAILDLTKKQNDLEKSIAQKVSDIAKDSRDIQRLRSLGTTEVSPATALQDELDNAKEKARIENIGYSTRASLIALEFELEALKLDRAQLSLENTVNTITAFNSGANKIGKEIASEVFEGLGDDKSYGNFVKAIKSKTFLDSSKVDEDGLAAIVDFSPEQLNSLWDYATGLDYTAKSKEALAVISRLQTALLDLETASNQSAVDAIKAKLEAYNNIFNVEQRRIDQSKIAIAQEEKMIAVQRESEDLYTSVLRARADTKLLKEGQKITSRTNLSREIEDESKSLERLKEDRIAQTKKAFEDSKQLTLEVDKLIEEYIIAKLNPNTDPVTLQQISDRITTADTARANAAEYSTAMLLKFDDQIIITEASIAKLGASATDLSTIIRDAKVKAQDNLGIAQAGLGMSLLGAGDTFRSLIEAEGQEREGGIAAVLADPKTMSKIRAASTEIEYMNIQAEGLSTIFSGIRTGIEGAFMAMVDGSKDAKQAFGDMAISILRSIADMIIQMLVFKLIQSTMGMFGVSAPSPSYSPGAVSVSALPEMPIKYANGGIIGLANGGVTARGLQGIVSKPTYLVGEGRYNEAVVPLPNGRSIPVQMHGGGSQSNNVSVNVNMTNNGSQTQMEGQDPTKLGQAVAAAVQRELVAQKAPGGLLNRYSAI